MRIRIISLNQIKFMVNPMLVTNAGVPKRYQGDLVYWSATGVDSKGVYVHPGAFQFVVR